MIDGTTTITTPGTAQQVVTTNKPCKRVWVQAHISNGDLTNGGGVVVGVSTVVAALSGRRGIALNAGEGEWFHVTNANQLYFDAIDATAKVHWIVEEF